MQPPATPPPLHHLSSAAVLPACNPQPQRLRVQVVSLSRLGRSRRLQQRPRTASGTANRRPWRCTLQSPPWTRVMRAPWHLPRAAPLRASLVDLMPEPRRPCQPLLRHRGARAPRQQALQPWVHSLRSVAALPARGPAQLHSCLVKRRLLSHPLLQLPPELPGSHLPLLSSSVKLPHLRLLLLRPGLAWASQRCRNPEEAWAPVRAVASASERPDPGRRNRFGARSFVRNARRFFVEARRSHSAAVRTAKWSC